MGVNLFNENLFSSKDQTWETPKDLFERLNLAFIYTFFLTFQVFLSDFRSKFAQKSLLH